MGGLFARGRAAAAALALLLGACGGDAGFVTDVGREEEETLSEVVQVEQGQLRGRVEGETLIFTRVPFAQPPVGELRWRAPQPPAAFVGERAATAQPPLCIQGKVLPGETSLEMSEDCLYLNIWVPNRRSTSLRPVMVWIHGGGLEIGGGSPLLQDGRELAESTGNVVVTINYRLGFLGFFSLPALRQEAADSGGNLGHLDQLAALRWLRANLRPFGGDSGRITLFGQSAGGQSICVHLASDRSEGLFRRAIIESFGCENAAAYTRAEADDQGETFTRLWSCDTAPDVLACLRGQSALTLRQALFDAGKTTTSFVADIDQEDPFRTSYSIDGRVLTGPVAEQLLLHNTSVPLLTGVTRNEMTLFLSHEDFNPPSSEAALRTAVADFLALYDVPADRLDAILAAYPQAPGQNESDVLAAITSDLVFACPTRRTADALANAGRPVWLYEFAFPPINPDLDVALLGGCCNNDPPEPGVFHGAELPFVFGNSGPLGQLSTEAARRLSRQVQAYWDAFAATGEPAVDNQLAWPAYGAANRQFLVLADPLSAAFNFRNGRCELLAPVATP